MNIENFINDFKNYCETIDDTKGIEIVKQRIFDNILNLELIVEDTIESNLNKRISELNNLEVIEQSELIARELLIASQKCRYIEMMNIRETWKPMVDMTYDKINDVFFDLSQTLFEAMYYSKYPKAKFEVELELKEEDLEKWYTELWDILEKYNIG